MTYVVPQKYKCIKCEHEFQYSPHHTHPAPVLSKDVETDRGTYRQSMPVCPSCWATFLLENIGIGYQTTVWNKDGSDYERALKEKAE